MGIIEKIANAKETTWLLEGLSEAEIKDAVESGKILAQIERCRLDMHMPKKEWEESKRTL